MRVSDAYPSNYLKASDLQNRNIMVVIDRVEIEKIGEDRKPVIYFRGKQKGLVANKTNCNAVAAVYGDEMDDWPGCELVLFSIWTDYQGKQVEAIRVRGPQPKDRKPATARPSSADMGGPSDSFRASEAGIRPPMGNAPQAPEHRDDPLDDPIPF
jgi:hypothetical protein